MTPFAIRSEFFTQYKAFKEEVEAMGWRFAEQQFQFEDGHRTEANLFFDKAKFVWWYPAFTSDCQTFHLPTDWNEALAFAMEQIKPEVKLPEKLWIAKTVMHDDVPNVLDCGDGTTAIVSCQNSSKTLDWWHDTSAKLASELALRYNSHTELKQENERMREALESITGRIPYFDTVAHNIIKNALNHPKTGEPASK